MYNNDERVLFMKRIIVIVVLFTVLVINQISAMTYTEDNAAYWYTKAFDELVKNTPEKEILELNKITSVEDYNNIPENIRKAIANEFQKLITGIKKAKSVKKCDFWEKYDNEIDEKTKQFFESRLYRKAFATINLMAWYAISMNKPDIAGALWQMILSISAKIGEHNIVLIRFICGDYVRQAIENIDSYCKNGASPEFKAKFCSYLKNKWPQSIFDIKDMINDQYEFWKSNLEYLANNQKALATYFGARNTPDKPKVIRNEICISRIRVINGVIEMYVMDHGEIDVSDYDKCMKKLRESGYLKSNDDFSCPENGIRTIKEVKDGDNMSYDITCSCVKEVFVDDFAEDSKPMQMAKQYREQSFNSEKETILKYYEIIKNYDHSRPLSDNLQTEIDELNERFSNGVVVPYCVIKYYDAREAFDRNNDAINAFLKANGAENK